MTRTRFAAILTLATAATVSACASTGATGQMSGSRDVLLAAEIQQAQVETAWEAVQRLRPQMVRVRGTMSARAPEGGEPVVYSDGVRLGGLETLRSIHATDVAEIRYLDARDATTRYGTGHAGGVILVRTRSGG